MPHGRAAAEVAPRNRTTMQTVCLNTVHPGAALQARQQAGCGAAPLLLLLLTLSPRSMNLTATSSFVTLFLISLATPKLPEPMSRICKTSRGKGCVACQHRTTLGLAYTCREAAGMCVQGLVQNQSSRNQARSWLPPGAALCSAGPLCCAGCAGSTTLCQLCGTDRPKCSDTACITHKLKLFRHPGFRLRAAAVTKSTWGTRSCTQWSRGAESSRETMCLLCVVCSLLNPFASEDWVQFGTNPW